ncbi:MAG: DUF1295 domain-containing protein [bacterium]
MWILNAIIIEGMALLGILSILRTRRTVVAFLAGFNTMAVVTGVYVWFGGLGPRTALVVAMVVVYLARMNWVLLVWSHQTALAKIDEQVPISHRMVLPIVLANSVGWAYCLPFYFAAKNSDTLGLSAALGAGVYILGTIFHFGADYQKRLFKTREGAAGELLDKGFWSLSRHPNYFGDFLIYVSFAIVGGNAWGAVAPLVNLLQYAFDAIPKSEKWAAERYGPRWDEYKSKTKTFVPYIV